MFHVILPAPVSVNLYQVLLNNCEPLSVWIDTGNKTRENIARTKQSCSLRSRNPDACAITCQAFHIRHARNGVCTLFPRVCLPRHDAMRRVPSQLGHVPRADFAIVVVYRAAATTEYIRFVSRTYVTLFDPRPHSLFSRLSVHTL